MIKLKIKMKKIFNRKNVVLFTFIIGIFLAFFKISVFAEQAVPLPKVGIDFGTSTNPKEVSSSIQILVF